MPIPCPYDLGQIGHSHRNHQYVTTTHFFASPTCRSHVQFPRRGLRLPRPRKKARQNSQVSANCCACVRNSSSNSSPHFLIVVGCQKWCARNKKEGKCTWLGLCDGCPECLGALFLCVVRIVVSSIINDTHDLDTCTIG